MGLNLAYAANITRHRSEINKEIQSAVFTVQSGFSEPALGRNDLLLIVWDKER